MRLSADITSALFKRYVIMELETIIDEEKQITHSEFADQIERFLSDSPKAMKKIKAPHEVRFLF